MLLEDDLVALKHCFSKSGPWRRKKQSI